MILPITGLLNRIVKISSPVADVSFNEEPSYRYAASGSPNRAGGGISGFLIRNKIANDERGAQYVMIACAVLAILAAIFIFMTSFKSPTPTLPPGLTQPVPVVK
jgi:hypothetical protein